ncbi:hypothetical protein KBD45_05085 [Candidatus Dojkabacteria bacterium]|nr:hypothetical protein [Candidatus Dojkabacteria bacterium]
MSKKTRSKGYTRAAELVLVGLLIFVSLIIFYFIYQNNKNDYMAWVVSTPMGRVGLVEKEISTKETREAFQILNGVLFNYSSDSNLESTTPYPAKYSRSFHIQSNAGGPATEINYNVSNDMLTVITGSLDNDPQESISNYLVQADNKVFKLQKDLRYKTVNKEQTDQILKLVSAYDLSKYINFFNQEIKYKSIQPLPTDVINVSSLWPWENNENLKMYYYIKDITKNGGDYSLSLWIGTQDCIEEYEAKSQAINCSGAGLKVDTIRYSSNNLNLSVIQSTSSDSGSIDEYRIF